VVEQDAEAVHCITFYIAVDLMDKTTNQLRCAWIGNCANSFLLI
jgi:hypothetical protein